MGGRKPFLAMARHLAAGIVLGVDQSIVFIGTPQDNFAAAANRRNGSFANRVLV